MSDPEIPPSWDQKKRAVRDGVAAMALQALISTPVTPDETAESRHPRVLAALAISYANELVMQCDLRPVVSNDDDQKILQQVLDAMPPFSFTREEFDAMARRHFEQAGSPR